MSEILSDWWIEACDEVGNMAGVIEGTQWESCLSSSLSNSTSKWFSGAEKLDRDWVPS